MTIQELAAGIVEHYQVRLNQRHSPLVLSRLQQYHAVDSYFAELYQRPATKHIPARHVGTLHFWSDYWRLVIGRGEISVDQDLIYRYDYADSAALNQFEGHLAQLIIVLGQHRPRLIIDKLCATLKAESP